MPPKRARNLIYLHGLNSSARSHKAGVLRERFAPRPVLTPGYPAHRPEAAVAHLSALLASMTDQPAPLVVGSSMGGFYGQYLARRFPIAHLFMINPALAPWDLLAHYEGETMTTAAGERYTVTPELVARTRPFGIDEPCDGVQTTLFLDEGDEVIDHRTAAALYRDCGRVLVYPGGDHAFAHLDEALALIESCWSDLG